MKATKGNMKNQILTKDRKILHCLDCGNEYSGNRDDYWNLHDDFVIPCGYCGGELELVEKHVSVAYV